MNIDTKILTDILNQFTPVQRREWLIKMLMAKHGQTFRSIAARHRLNHWYLNGMVIGRFPFNKKCVAALEKEFGIKMPLTALELKKMGGKL